MCGIAFAIRPSASYLSSGASPPSDTAGSPLSSASTPLPSAGSPANDFGMTFPDGTKPEATDYLDANKIWNGVSDAVKPRGPDYHNQLLRYVQAKKNFHFEMRFHASVLHMRGDDLTKQPFVAENGDVLLFNGEIFDGLAVDSHSNDGQALFNLILREGPSNFFAAIRSIEGPYAFIYYQSSNHRIYFGRDPLGRRSLVMHRPTPISPSLYLASNAPGAGFPLDEWEEVACDAVHCYHLLDLKGKTWAVDGRRGLSSYPRYPRSMGLSQDILIYPFDRLLTTVPTPSNLLPLDLYGTPIITAQLHITIQAFLRELERSLRSRILSLPPSQSPTTTHTAAIAVLFSGGIDCTTLALLTDRILPPGEEIDLINVAFENPRVVKGQQNPNGNPKSKNGKGKGKGKKGGGSDGMEIDGAEVEVEVGAGADGEGWETDPEVEGADEGMEDAPIPVDPAVYNVPDRLTGLASWKELQALRPTRKWNFVEVNVPYQEMLREKPKVIDLMRPQRTVMDLSIAIAFYFAARGIGQLPTLPTPTPYTSTARVLLSGLGADELLGGYARHRRAFHKTPGGGDWRSVISELQMDIDRLPTRNLGRDDRIISFHGKEARYPFLAGHVVDFCARTPVWMKMDYRFPEGVGDKMLLRLLAKQLGLKDAAGLKKRAIHFGARTAKMELGSGRDKGEMLID